MEYPQIEYKADAHAASENAARLRAQHRENHDREQVRLQILTQQVKSRRLAEQILKGN